MLKPKRRTFSKAEIEEALKKNPEQQEQAREVVSKIIAENQKNVKKELDRNKIEIKGCDDKAKKIDDAIKKKLEI